MSKLKLIIFADLHYLDKVPEKRTYDSIKKLYAYALPLLDKLIDLINNGYKPDVVINLGDMIEDTLDVERDLNNIKFIWSKLQQIKPPHLYMLGNHELRSMDSVKQVEEVIGYEKSTYSIDINGYHLVVLSPEIRNEYGLENGGILRSQYISSEDISWLKEDLKNNNLPTVIFTHYALAEIDTKGNYWFEKHRDCALLKNRNEIKEIIKNDKNVLAVFSGHLHTTGNLIEDGIPYYQVGSLTYNTEDNGITNSKLGTELVYIKDYKENPDGVYFEVNIDGKNMEVIEHHVKL